ncbi:TPA: hypothetical protein ACIV3Q_003896 [Salmonella enterica subsp. enterica serovar Enteritidis]|uniref:hypothetical protein n=1 Tax=Escherichia coli TaxID=562 RepID=UPI001BFF70BD|nr:hypothetical protein [Escherichia coli]HAY1958498.1 hypothetical protein [Escherichia coli]HBE3526947.1 hypothetical protein [Escherichia coli]HBH9677776.1 hypothetical protein [Escherichia coli]
MQDNILLILIALGFVVFICFYSEGVFIDKIINFYQNIGKNKKAKEALKRSIESDRKNNRLK